MVKINKFLVFLNVTCKTKIQDFIEICKKWGVFIFTIISHPPEIPTHKDVGMGSGFEENREKYHKAIVKFSEDRISILFSTLSFVISVAALIVSVLK